MPTPRWASYLLLNSAFAFGYLVLANLGITWSSLDAHISLVWPAAGLAVFGVQQFGPRILPGIFLGALGSTLAFQIGPQLGFGAMSIGAALLMSGAVIVSPWLVYLFNPRLFRRHKIFGLALTLRYLSSVMFCSTLSASIGVPLFNYLGLVNSTDLLSLWTYWWLGDAIGMLLFTAIFAWVFIADIRRRNTYMQAFLLQGAGFGLVLFVTLMLGHNEQLAERNRFTFNSGQLFAALKNPMDLTQRDLQLINHYYFNNNPGREEFLSIASSILKRSSWLNSLSWIPVGTTNATRKQLSYARGWSLPQQAQSLTPLEAQVTRAEFREIQAQALASLNTTVSPIITDSAITTNATAHTLDAQPRLLMYVPIFTCNNRYQNRNTQCTPKGLVVADINLSQWIAAAYQHTLIPNLGLAITHPDALTPLIWQQGDWLTHADGIINFFSQRGLYQEKLLTIADRKLKIYTQTHSASSYLPSWQQFSLLAIGMGLVGLLGAYLTKRQEHDDLLAQNQQRLESEIDYQTQALRKANDWLLQEIEQRNQIQQVLELSQNNLKEREQQLRSLLDNIPDPIWLKSLTGNYLICNKAFAAMLGHTEAEVLAHNERELVTGELLDMFHRNDRRALDSHSSYRHEQWLNFSGRKARLMDTFKIALRNDVGDAYGILGIARDITDKHDLISELEKFKRFAEFSSQGFGITDLDGTILYMNPSLNFMLTGTNELCQTAQQFWSYYSEPYQTLIRTEIMPQVISQGHWQGEMELRRYDNSTFPSSETLFIIRDDHGNPLYIGDVVIDISVQKQTQAELQAAKLAAEEATQAKSRFLANMSHEIRTPLNAVLGYTQLLMRDEQLLGAQRARLNFIYTASQRLLGLINDILDLSKIESGVLHLRVDYFDLYQELEDIKAIMSERSHSKGLALLTQFDLPQPSMVKGDRQKIGQILINLLGNAIKFTQRGSVSIKVARQFERVAFEIADTGPGIAETELRQLFSAFKQGQAGTDNGGTGLGLTLSRYLAEGMGGSLQLTSILGEGTQAHLVLDLPSESLVQQSPELDDAQVLHLAPGTCCKVLVVEDDIASSDVLVSLLTQIGCAIFTAENGRAGLAQCATQHPDIIFTDIRMPDINGLEMLHLLRELPECASIPVIAVSASSLEHERSYYMAQGFQDFIGKPYGFFSIFRNHSAQITQNNA